MSCQIIPLNLVMLCWSCWSRMWYRGWWSGKKSLTIILKSRGMCFKSPLPIKTTNRKRPRKPQRNKQKPLKNNQPNSCFITYEELPHLRTWGRRFCLPLGMLSPEPSTELCVRRWSAWYGSWPHLSGNCYRWFNSLAARTPSKHHLRVWGPHLD